MALLSVIIPSRKEIFLNHTIRDVLQNSKGQIEILPVLDGYEPDELIDDPRVRYIRLPEAKHTQKRHGINQAVSECNGDYVMSLDAHCMVAPSFDVQLINDMKEDNWVMIPRRQRLDAENWCQEIDDRPPVDYEYLLWPLKFDPPGLHGFRWDARTLERKDIPIDQTMHFQGSCWILRKDYFNHLGLMAQLEGEMEGYSGWGMEAEEIFFKVRKDGGKTLTNKNTQYFHLHKGTRWGRGYWMSRKALRDCIDYTYNHWVKENSNIFIEHIEAFWPLPSWPHDWKKRIYG